MWANIGSAILGALLGMGTKWVEQIRERRRRRKAIATVLLSELRAVELDARQLYETPKAALRGGELPGRTFIRLRDSDDLFLLKPTTISRVLNLAALLGDSRDMIQGFQGGKITGEWVHTRLRQTSGFLAQQVPELKEALVEEGGSLPVAEELQVVYGEELPTLPARAFAEWNPESLKRE